MDEIYHKSCICANPHNEFTTYVQMKDNLYVEMLRRWKRSASILSQWYNHHLLEKVEIKLRLSK